MSSEILSLLWKFAAQVAFVRDVRDDRR